MKRRDFVKSWVATWVNSAQIGRGVEARVEQTESGDQPASKQAVPLENGLYRVEVDSERGLILRLLDKASGVELITEPRLADNFRLLLPIPDLEANYVWAGNSG